MANMSYCRFQNTANDLRDCVQNLRTLDPEDRSFNTDEERRARRDIIEMAAQLITELGIDDPADGWEVERAVDALDAEPLPDEPDDQ
jgi:hypothetical protein